MLMCEQMILTILIISLTFGAETKFQIRIIQFGPATDRTFMLGDLRTASVLSGACPVSSAAVYLMRRIALQISGRQIKDQEIQQ